MLSLSDGIIGGISKLILVRFNVITTLRGGGVQPMMSLMPS